MHESEGRWTQFVIRGAAVLGIAVGITGCGRPVSTVPRGQTPAGQAAASESGESESDMSSKVLKSDEEWKAELSDEAFDVLRNKGTERAFTGDYWDHKDDGVYHCRGCGHPLFTSESKFDSGTGWPSFWEPISDQHVATADDRGWFMRRTEVLCARCDGHLGHVFDDGPDPTGLRYCINSVSLEFRSEDDTAAADDISQGE